ncbi:hypothetical protein AB0G60_16660 [Streptomyces angustmyceticus]|uniref:Uncharacterized protein n=1 Tax=Streptomyces angustmyceticus TaxID=285578 RepID=A0A5J4LKQ0_9ACTN|nr:hypothetical protein [Streptomyces angustmyceticus]UAL70266.1 hypothetical protein K7396_29925 [Streptomyces angustmyceticus]GES34216.1 hypothetical protein San01_67040 [Streptomyces angustmyceticus]GES34657.1 hypothetical protein San01_71450 [Streptomyces angustmyceticus]
MSHSQHPAPFGPPPHPFGPPPVAQPPKKKHAALRIAVGVVCAFIVFGLGAAVGSGGDGTKKAAAKPAPTVTVTVTAQAAKAAAEKPKSAAKPAEKAKSAAQPAKEPDAPAGPDTTVGEGSYLVGEDIAAGMYKTAGPDASGSPLCYWERAKDSSGEMDSIIANDTPQGPARVTVNKGETFKTNGCKEWVKVG